MVQRDQSGLYVNIPLLMMYGVVNQKDVSKLLQNMTEVVKK
jgi:hypothetical protein